VTQGTTQEVQARDDVPHEHGNEPGWSERVQFAFFDSESGFGGLVRATYHPRDRQADASLTLFVPGGAIATVLTKEKERDARSHSVARLTLEVTEPLARWNIRCKDIAMVFPGASVTGLPKSGERHGAGGQIELDLDFEAWCGAQGSVERVTTADEMGFVRTVSSGHLEQAGRFAGRVRLGNRAATMDCAGTRTRTWGARASTATHASRWFAASFSPTFAFSARAITMGERSMQSGWVLTPEGVRAITTMHAEMEYEGRAPAAVRLQITDESGAHHEVDGEAIVALPVREDGARVHQTMMRYRSGDREVLGLCEAIEP